MRRCGQFLIVEHVKAGVAEQLKPQQTWFTHIAHEVLHAREAASLPEGVQIAYDGLQLTL